MCKDTHLSRVLQTLEPLPGSVTEGLSVKNLGLVANAPETTSKPKALALTRDARL